MKGINRRQFLILSLGFAGRFALPKAYRVATAIGRPPLLMRPPRAYGASAYGEGVYGSPGESPLQKP